MSELHETTANIRLQRLRRYVDGEIERWNNFHGSGFDFPRSYPEGRVDTLELIRALYLLTPEEASEAGAVRREMFG